MDEQRLATEAIEWLRGTGRTAASSTQPAGKQKRIVADVAADCAASLFTCLFSLAPRIHVTFYPQPQPEVAC